MTDPKDRWDDVGRSFSALGRRLDDRFRAMRDDEQGEVSDALDGIVEKLDRVFTSLGETLRDPESREAVERAARSLGDAVAGTFEDVGRRIGRRAGTEDGPPAGPDA